MVSWGYPILRIPQIDDLPIILMVDFRNKLLNYQRVASRYHEVTMRIIILTGFIRLL